MTRLTKLGIVLGGYALAILASIVAVAVYDRRFTPADNQTMGGMIAGGEMILGAGVFALVSIAPTGFALWSLRQDRTAWSVFSIASLAFSGLGLAAVVASISTPGPAPSTLLSMVADLLALAQMLGSPVWVAGCGLFALLAPARDLRWRLLAAMGLEIVVGVSAFVHFVVRR